MKTKLRPSRFRLSLRTNLLPVLLIVAAHSVPLELGVVKAAGLEPTPGSFFVATNGNDAWSGTLAAPNATGTDGPFASLARARDAVRSRNRETGVLVKQAANVVIRGGTYFLREPVVFKPEDSGATAGPVTYAAYPGEQPVISGGRRITGWRTVTIDGRDLWSADLADIRNGKWSFHELWIDGQRRRPARYPHQGYLAVAAIPGTKPNQPWSEGVSQFRFKDGDLKAWKTVTQADVCVMSRWVESHLPVVSVDEASHLVNFAKRSVFSLEVGDLYYVENALELLDTPGEWYLDRAAGILYYLPRTGEDPNQIVAIAPVLSQVLRFEGEPQNRRFIENLRFEGLAFAHTEWYFPSGFAAGKNKPEISPPPQPEVGGFAQAAIGVPGAVWGEGMKHCTFDRCRFAHLGGYAVELGRGCQQNRISHSEIADLGAGGIKLGETGIRNAETDLARDNEVSDCRIHDGGQLFHSAIGVWIGQSPANRIIHNEIHDFYYTGISIGWTWGYGPALATNNLVEFNHVHHIGVRSDGDGPILSDMGGIYTLGLHRGTVIRNNLWHDCAGFRYGGWGIYFDEGTTEILAENNLVYRTTHGGFHQHYGKDNEVRNNIFAFGRDQQIQRSRVEAHRSFTFEHNLVLWKQGALFAGNLSGTNYLFKDNLYWRQGDGEVKFDKWSFADWQKRGQDNDSILADPKFVDPEQGDFALKPGSPATRIGFKPFDLKSVGPRPIIGK